MRLKRDRISPNTPSGEAAHMDTHLTLFDDDLRNALDGLRLPLMRRPPLLGAFPQQRGARQGDSQDFMHHRSYTPGDDFRHIDWSLFGRTRRLFTKQFFDEKQPVMVLVIDSSHSMAMPDPPHTFHYARQLGLALMWVAIASGYSCQCVMLNDTENAIGTSINTRNQFFLNAVRNMAEVKLHGTTNYNSLSILADPLRRQSGIVMVLSDFLLDPDPLPAQALAPAPPGPCGNNPSYARLVASTQQALSAINHLNNGNLAIMLLATLAHPIMDSSRRGHLQDVETQEKIRLAWSDELLKHYAMAQKCHHALLKSMAEDFGMLYTPIDLPNSTLEPQDAVSKQAGLVKIIIRQLNSHHDRIMRYTDGD